MGFSFFMTNSSKIVFYSVSEPTTVLKSWPYLDVLSVFKLGWITWPGSILRSMFKTYILCYLRKLHRVINVIHSVIILRIWSTTPQFLCVLTVMKNRHNRHYLPSGESLAYWASKTSVLTVAESGWNNVRIMLKS